MLNSLVGSCESPLGSSGSSAPCGEDPDAGLVQRCLGGDKQAFDVLMERYSQRLGGIISRLTQKPQDTEDILQETFVRAYQKLPQYRQEGPFAAWLYRIALNQARNHRQQAWVRRVVSLQGYQEQKKRDRAGNGEPEPSVRSTEAGTNPIEDLVLRREKNGHIQQALDQLPEKFRLPLLLHYFDDRTGEEIAQILGIPPGTVWSRLHSGLGKLRSLLEPYFGSSEPDIEKDMQKN